MGKLYFVFDTYMNDQYMREILRAPHGMGKAILPKARIEFKGSFQFAWLTVERTDDDNDSVDGYLWELNTTDQEEFERVMGLSRRYKKVKTKVQDRGGKTVPAIMFILHNDYPERSQLRLEMPLAEYFERLLVTYKAKEFDISKLYKALLRAMNSYYRKPKMIEFRLLKKKEQ